MGHDSSAAAYAIRLLACDLCDANEDSLRRFKKGLCGICTTPANPHCDGHVMKEFVAFANSDWAGDRHTRKSASGVALHVDGCVMLVICRGQLIRARSTAEAEVHVAVMGLKVLPHVQMILTRIGEPMRARLRLDSAAGRSVLMRAGLDVHDTWR